MAQLILEISEEAKAMLELMEIGGAKPMVNPTITFTRVGERENGSGAFGDTMDEAIRNAFKNWQEGMKNA